MLLLSSAAGSLAQRIGPRIPLTVGPLVTTLGLLSMSRVDPRESYVSGVLPAVIVFGDARGYGETRYSPEDGWSPVDDALSVLDAAGCGRVCVIACSAGGQTAIDLALSQPERVGSLVLIGSGARGAPATADLPAATAELVARIEAAESTGDLELVNRLEAWLWLDGPSAPEGRVAGRTRELFLEMNATGSHTSRTLKPIRRRWNPSRSSLTQGPITVRHDLVHIRA